MRISSDPTTVVGALRQLRGARLILQKIKTRSSCEIEHFVETHILQAVGDTPLRRGVYIYTYFFFTLERNHFRAPKSLPILNSSKFVPKTDFQLLRR